MPLDYTRNRHDGVEQERDTGWWSANIHFQPDDENRTAKTGHCENTLMLISYRRYWSTLKIDHSSSSNIDKEEDWRREIYLFFHMNLELSKSIN